MKHQKWYRTNIGFSATKNKLFQSRGIAGDLQDNKGRLSFHLIDFKDFTIQITTKGKLGIFYPEKSKPQVVLEKLKPFLVTAEGAPAKIIKKIPLKNSQSTAAIGESEHDKAKAISLMKAFEPMIGCRFSEEEWAYVLNENNGKKMLDKARALIELRGIEALV